MEFYASQCTMAERLCRGYGKRVKKSVKGAIGEQVLSYSKLQTVFSEAANLVNEKPIARHSTEP